MTCTEKLFQPMHFALYSIYLNFSIKRQLLYILKSSFCARYQINPNILGKHFAIE